MTEYIIKNYQEGFIEEQVKVGSEVTKDWLLFGQTSVEQLQNIYSQPDFDPETRLYCFKDDKMVSFLTGKIVEEEGKKVAFLRFPYALPGHESTEDLLFNKFNEIAKKKGATLLRANVSDSWSGNINMAKRWGFEKNRDDFVLCSLNIEKAKVNTEITEDIEPFDYERDIKQMIAIFQKEYNMPEEVARKNFEYIRDTLNVIAHTVRRRNGEIIGRSLVYTTEADKTLAYLGNIFAQEESLLKQLLADVINKCKEAGVKKLLTAFSAQQTDLSREFERSGFEVETKVSIFEKDI
ncbi:MAG: hypothetical protein ACTSQE_03915 [Candidatus Heimdallarchaeaceae archaeon]